MKSIQLEGQGGSVGSNEKEDGCHRILGLGFTVRVGGTGRLSRQLGSGNN